VSAIYDKTVDDLQKRALENRRIAVSFSGGKDSLVTLDLCRKAFQEVICFFMYFIPGLEHIEKQLAYARERWHVEIIQYPHPNLTDNLIGGIYCPNYYKLDDLMPFKIADIYRLVKKETGATLIATGSKRSDYYMRMAVQVKDTFLPLKDWNKFDVMAYLQRAKIPLPQSSGKATTGVGLATPSLLWLHDTYPEDFKKLLTFFPYAEAAVWRRTYYGIE